MPERYVYGEWSKDPQRRARRVVVTGMGMATPLGNNVQTNWERIKAGETGAEPLDAEYKTDIKVVGRVHMNVVDELEPYNVLSQDIKRDFRKADSPLHKSVQVELPPIAEALKHAGLLKEDGSYTADRTRTGIVMATAVGGAPGILRDKELMERRNGTSPSSIPRLDVNRVTSVPGWLFGGFHGPSYTVLAACAGSTVAEINSYKEIYNGDADVMITGGTDAFIDVPEMIKNFEALGTALSRESDSKTALRAYDKHPTGTVPGEGAGVLIFESEEHAVQRGAKIYALVGGYGLVNDGYHEVHISDEGYAFREGLIQTLMKMGATEGDHYHSGHGGGTPDDTLEALGLLEARRIMGRTEEFMLVSNKGQITHQWGADGTVRSIIGILAMREQIAIPTYNSQDPIGPYVLQKLRYGKIFFTKSNTGLGGITPTIGFLPYSPL